MQRIIVLGSVKSTAQTLKSLKEHGFNIVGVIGYTPQNTDNVSGWVDLKSLADTYNIPFKGFIKVNDDEVINWSKNLKPDVIFAIGFSQLLKKEWLEMPRLGVIGFHPTMLPEGRGRAPIAWLIIEGAGVGAATFFLMGEGADDGPIFIQEKFLIDECDDSESVESKILSAITKALNNWLPKLKTGEWDPVPQDEAAATWFGKRTPRDGLINWHDKSKAIDRLIKAATRPHPGAYSFINGKKIKIYKSKLEDTYKIKGAVGRILLFSRGNLLVKTGEGLIWLEEYNCSEKIKVGDKLGFSIEDEIFKIKKDLENLKKHE